MKNLNELKLIAKEYIKEKKENAILFDPIFRLENDKLCFMYSIMEYADESNNDYRIRSTKEWVIQDIVSGDIITYNDASNEEKIGDSIDKIFDNSNNSPLYDQANTLILSFQKWQKDILNQLNSEIEKSAQILYDEKVMKVNTGLISPKDYIFSNIDGIFEKMLNILCEDTGSMIEQSYKEFESSLFENIRNHYLDKNFIDKELIKEHMNLLKYLWPNFLELINHSSNIDGICDEKYDKMLLQALDKKL